MSIAKKYFSQLLVHILCRIYRLIPRVIIRQPIIWLIIALDEGKFFSPSLRKLFLDIHNITIGMYTYGGCFRLGNVPPGTVIGRYCSFADTFHIFDANHPLTNMSTHPLFYNSKYMHFGLLEQPVSKTQLVIGHDVWVGRNAIILPSVQKIGTGAVIGAGSVVKENVPPYAIVAGNPAQIIRYRFSPEKIEHLLRSAWWDKDVDELIKYRSTNSTLN